MPIANQLIHETSPYLLQHAYNPVEWYAWKPEAFEKAKNENLPILVSIGYSTCHWCHVMERESFEDSVIASFMNQHFVNIKVDREERPDVDQIYMEACQAINGSGGWPLNCFLTPDGRPFYAGTYFPPNPAYRRPSWLQVLQNISQAFQQKRTTIEEQADRLTDYIRRSDTTLLSTTIQGDGTPSVFNKEMIRALFENLEKGFDKINGGFGGAPKFPGTMALRFLLDYQYHTQEAKALEHLERSLDQMIRGGIYDQIGGGFARYATDSKWLVPHFEKMLYDNALLIGLLSDAYRATKKDLYKETIEECLDFIEREMTSEEGGFYTALDADSEGVEGKFYVWQKDEIEEVLKDSANVFCAFYGVNAEGNWEGTNILWREESMADFAVANGLDVVELRKQLRTGRAALLQKRAERIRPGLDDKILLGWNALQCSAYAKAYRGLQLESYRAAALKNIHFLLSNFKQDDELLLYHGYKDGIRQYTAFLDDYAYLIEALLNVYRITFDEQWLQKAIAYSDFVIAQFYDPASQLFFYTIADQKDILLRRKEVYDSATPSGNSTMAHCLYQLAIITDNNQYRDIVTKMLDQIEASVLKYPSSFGRWARAILYQLYPIYEIAVVGKAFEKTTMEINKKYLGGSILMASEKPDAHFPLLKDKQLTKDTYIYVCQDYACQLPVSSIEAFDRLIEKR